MRYRGALSGGGGGGTASDPKYRDRQVSNDSPACQSLRTSSNVQLASGPIGAATHAIVQQRRPTQSQHRSCVNLGDMAIWPEITPV